VRILVAGDWHSKIHEEAIYRAFITLGHEAVRFSWHQYFRPVSDGLLSKLSGFSGRVQNRFITGPAVGKLNTDFLSVVSNVRPDVIFVYRGTHITAATLLEVKENLPSTILVGYNNDDPFAKGHPYWLWRHFLKAVPIYDLMLAYRHHNIAEFQRIGAKRVFQLRSWFIPERNCPTNLSPEDLSRFSCDVVFVGHFEMDGRLQLLEEIVRAGFHLKLFGPEWEHVQPRSRELCQLAPIFPVHGNDYRKAISGAKIALCFLSKHNRDTYTRRCFEIPATGTFMLSEYSDDLATLFTEGIEADFFRSSEELLMKLRLYLGNDVKRQEVAAAGFSRVWADGHDVVSRMKQVAEWISHCS
jgi:hypothetical protein